MLVSTKHNLAALPCKVSSLRSKYISCRLVWLTKGEGDIWVAGRFMDSHIWLHMCDFPYFGRVKAVQVEAQSIFTTSHELLDRFCSCELGTQCTGVLAFILPNLTSGMSCVGPSGKGGHQT